MGRLGVDDNESLASARLDESGLNELLTTARQLTYVFVDEGGWPSGVIMSYLYDHGRFWMTSVEGRSQVTGSRNDSRVTLVIDNRGTGLEGRRMVSVRGRAFLRHDRATKDWFYARFAALHAPDNAEAYVRLLDSEHRVVIEVVLEHIGPSHDSRKMAGDGRGGHVATNDGHDEGRGEVSAS